MAGRTFWSTDGMAEHDRIVYWQARLVTLQGVGEIPHTDVEVTAKEADGVTKVWWGMIQDRALCSRLIWLRVGYDTKAKIIDLKDLVSIRALAGHAETLGLLNDLAVKLEEAQAGLHLAQRELAVRRGGRHKTHTSRDEAKILP